MKEENKIKSHSGIGYLIASAAVFLLIIIMTFIGMKNLGNDYLFLKSADLNQDINSTVSYNDHIYAQIGFGIQMSPEESKKENTLSDFLETSIRAIDSRIVSVGIIYTMMVVTLLACFLFRRFGLNPVRHVISVIISSVGIYCIFILSVFIFHLVFHVPFGLMPWYGILLVIAGVTSVTAGSCVLGALLRVFRRKNLIAILGIVLVFGLYFITTVTEVKLYCPPTEDSFEYVVQENPQLKEDDFDGEYRYDEDKNVVILDGKEYKPKKVESTNYIKGFPRIAAYIFEVVNPYSGNALSMINDAGAIEANVLIPVLYLIKGFALAAASVFIKKKKSPQET